MDNVDFSTVGFTLEQILALGVFRSHLNNEKKSVVVVKKIELSLDEPVRKKHIDLLKSYITPILALKHENVMEYYGFRVIPQPSLILPPEFVIFMEYCQGGDLLQKARKEHPLPLQKIHSWTKSILEGLSYLHANKVVHRNINASNIFLSDEIIKIGGLTTGRQLRESMTMAKEVSHSRGPSNHMSPEMILAYSEENMNIGRKTDIWSLGCTVIEMLTGQKLQYFKTDTGEEIKEPNPVMNFIAHGGKPFYPAGTPDKLRDFLEKCFIFEPNKRPGTDELLQSTFITAPL